MDRDSPYPGLDAFGEEDAAFFFGRTRDVTLIVANLFASPLTVLYGPSGVGKTSVLHAGVLPALRRRHIVWTVLDSWSGGAVDTLRRGIAEVASQAETPGGARRRAVLVLDQFEDYFLGRADDRAFASELAGLMMQPGHPSSVLVAVREDVLTRLLDHFEGRIPSLLDKVLRLDHLDRSAGGEAIVGPLEAWNALVPEVASFEIEDGLVDAVLDGVAAGHERVETALLQLVMKRLWDEREGTGPYELRRRTFDELGGVPGIVAGHVTGALDALTRGEQGVAAAILGHLVTPSRLRIAQRSGDLAGYARVDESELRPLLERLSDDRVLRPIADVEGTDPRYEVRHDSLADAVLAWRTSFVTEQQVAAERRRFQRRLLLVVVAALAFAALAALVTYTWTQRQTARSEALSAEALGLLATDPGAALEKAVDAVETRSIRAAENALRTTLAQSHQRAVIGGEDAPAIRSIDVGPDGELLTTDDSGTLLLRTPSGDVLREFTDLPPVGDSVFCPGPDRLAVAGEGGALLVTPQRRIRLGRDPVGPHSISCSGDGSRIVTVSDEAVRVYSIAGRELATIGGHESGPVEDAALSRNGALAVTVGVDGARVVRVSNGREVGALDDELVSVAFSADGSRVVAGGADGEVLLWEPGPGSPPAVLRGHGEFVRDVAFSRDGTLVVSVSTDRTARLWDARGGEELAVLRGHRGIVESAAFGPDGESLATASADGTVRIWATPIVSILAGHRQNVRAVAVNADGSRVATAAEDVRVWDAATGRQLARFPARTVSRLALSSDGLRVLTAHSNDGRARLWDTGRPGRPLVLPAAVVTTVAFTSDGRTAVTAGRNAIVLFELSGREIGRLRAPPDIEEIGRISLAPGGDRLAVAEVPEGVVAILELETGSELARLSEEDLQSLAVAFGPDGERVVTAEAGGVARIWEAGSGDHDPPALAGHDGAVLSATLSPDSELLLTAGTDGTARIWHVDSGAQLAVLRGRSAAFASTESILVTGGPGTTARVVRCEACGSLEELLDRARDAQG